MITGADLERLKAELDALAKQVDVLRVSILRLCDELVDPDDGIERFDWSVRAENCLKGYYNGNPEIKTLRELATYNKKDLLKRRWLGRRVVGECETVLAEHGLRLGMTAEEADAAWLKRDRRNSTVSFEITDGEHRLYTLSREDLGIIHRNAGMAFGECLHFFYSREAREQLGSMVIDTIPPEYYSPRFCLLETGETVEYTRSSEHAEPRVNDEKYLGTGYDRPTDEQLAKQEIRRKLFGNKSNQQADNPTEQPE